MLLALLALLYWDDNWARDVGLLLAGAECLTVSYLLHRSARRGRDLPAGNQRLIRAMSGVVTLLLLITVLFV